MVNKLFQTNWFAPGNIEDRSIRAFGLRFRGNQRGGDITGVSRLDQRTPETGKWQNASLCHLQKSREQNRVMGAYYRSRAQCHGVKIDSRCGKNGLLRLEFRNCIVIDQAGRQGGCFAHPHLFA